jgi:hypothetical protein
VNDRFDASELWTVYDHPSDLPDWFVVRRQWIWSMVWPDGRRRGARAFEAEASCFHDLERARLWLAHRGLTCLTRSPGDDPVILETWI